VNARSFWGVAIGERCSDGLPACYVVLHEYAVFLGCCSWRTLQRWTACLLCCFARMRDLFGVLQLANFAAMDCLPVTFFCVNARSFWGVAVGEHRSDGLPAFFCVLFARMCGLRQVITTFWYGLLYCTCNPMSKSLFPEIRTSITITSINNN